ncbi:AAA family ATPase [Alloyangia pacifica]|uniref:AAA family ATPase n=1 Tax=Alloyangia pacifica TaxID=311180 RepID=UPI001CFE21D1|nr:helicase RepA family protein [Alloyangia pacifica]
MRDFAEMADELRAHEREHAPAGYMVPGNAARADQLRNKLQPLGDVKPVINSRYLVKGWIDAGAFSVTYGDSNVGKTFLALDMSLHVAAGRDWHGNKVSQGGVVYVAGEGGKGIRNRIEAARREDPDFVQSADSAFLLLPETLDLCADVDAKALTAALRSMPIQATLIVIDTLARAMGAGDENAAPDMGRFVRNIDLIRAETGAHVMVIHHSGKDASKGARGSSALRAAVDTEIELTRTDSTVMAETRKQRDMSCDNVFAYTIRSVFLGTDEDGDAVTSAVVQPAEPVQKKAKVSGQQKVALQALADAMAHHGETKLSDMYPSNRQCVSLSTWQEYCNRHSLSSGESSSAKRKAFFTVKNALQEKGVVRVVDDYVWRCDE